MPHGQPAHDGPAALCRPADVTSTTTQSQITRAAPIDLSVSLPSPPLPPPAEWPRLRHQLLQPAKHSTSCSAWTTVPARAVSTRRSCFSHGCEATTWGGKHARIYVPYKRAATYRPVRPTPPAGAPPGQGGGHGVLPAPEGSRHSAGRTGFQKGVRPQIGRPKASLSLGYACHPCRARGRRGRNPRVPGCFSALSPRRAHPVHREDPWPRAAKQHLQRQRLGHRPARCSARGPDRRLGAGSCPSSPG